ncbi:MAG: type III polyketide synthase [Calditrichaeota bacterium]|nr:MAG: type III polyketide synthase [Calditrichota bacterium]
MPRIVSIQCTVPEYRVDQQTALSFASRIFSDANLNLTRLLPIFQHTRIETRYFCVPPEWFDAVHPFSEKNRIYRQNAIKLSEAAIRQIFESTGVQPQQVGHIFFVSTTGLATPSIDAHLFNLLKLRPSIRRTPIWGLGCAGGIAGINRAMDWLKAYPEEMALVIAVELCGLTFIRNDLSKSNFVATSLFADGCGAALLAGDRCGIRAERSLEIQCNTSTTWEDSLSVMGWNIGDDGFKVLFSKSIPQIVSQSALPSILGFLQENGLTLETIDYFLSHPGGAKVIDAYQQSLGLREEQIRSMKEVLRNYGNMSSATVYFVLQDFLNSPDYRPGARILSTALGPGFSSEMFLAQCL